jgi:hypothetical protein
LLEKLVTANRSRGDRLVWPIVLVGLVACACGGRPIVKATPTQWDEARGIAERYADETHHVPAEKVRAANPRLPFLFDAALPGMGAILVHDGVVTHGGGASALGRYLDDVDVYSDRALTTDDVLELVYVFEVFPPVDTEATTPEGYFTDEDGDFAMRSAWHGHDLDFTLAYRLQYPSDPDTHASDSSDDTWVMHVSFWTLHLRKGTAPTWTEERRDFTRKREPVDDE